MLYRYPKSKKYPYEIPTKTGHFRAKQGETKL